MNRPAVLTAVILTSVVAFHSVAKADEVTRTQERVEPGYAYQVVLADAIAVAALVAAFNTNSDALENLAFVPFATFSPAVHIMHGNPGRAAASLGLHTAVPFGFAAIGYLLQRCDDDDWLCGLEGAGLGMITGMAAATAIDAFVLARPKRVQNTNMAFTVAPSFKIASGAATFGIVGTM